MKSPIQLLSWDTRFFGRRIAQMKTSRLTPAIARTALRACRRQQVAGLYYLAAAQDAPSIACAEANGFRLADIRMTFIRPLAFSQVRRVPLDRRPGPRYGPARVSDRPALKRLAARLFVNSRFAVDPHFARHAYRRLFATWIAKSVRGQFDDWVGVARMRGRVAGFVSCRRLAGRQGRIGLIGVAPAFGGRGVGHGLLELAHAWLAAQGVRRVAVSTQGRTIAAQALFQSCGYRSHRVELWYHRWF